MKVKGNIFDIRAVKELNFSVRPGEFGRAWVVKNNHRKTSSLVAIIDGLKKYFLLKL